MIVHKPSGKLILNLREPGRVTTVVPTAKSMVFKGETLVVVPHREDEVRVLRNLGFDPPSPISTYYEWPGRFAPYAHQKATAEFLTLNPWAFCLNGMGCIEGDAKVRVSRKGKSVETDLRTLHRKFHALPDRDAWKARSLKGDQFGMNKLLDVLYKGEQPTLRITLADGKVFRCTPDHRLAQADGSWLEAGALAVGGHLVTNGSYSVRCGDCGESREKKTPLRHPGQVCNPCRHKAHSAKMRGANNPSWAGGRFVDGDGYVRVSIPGHHRADSNGFVYEHIAVAEGLLGEPIYADRHVHHVNGNKADNSPSNLEVLSAGDHHRQHATRAHLDGAHSSNGGLVVVLPKTSTVVSIEDGGVTDVYDLCMEAPHHNFVVNGVVVHNSGKTLSILWAFDYLKSRGLAKRMLVVAPLSTLTRTWADEAFTHFPEMTCGVLYGTMDRRIKLLAVPHDVYVINHDAIKSKEMLAALTARLDIDVVVIDEVAAFRTAGTERFKAAQKLVKNRTYVWGLTGTPTPNGPTDAWAQCRLITPHTVPAYSGQFRDRVMKQVSSFKWIAREDALTAVRDCMQPAIRFSRQDCIDLPPTTYQTRTVSLTPEQKTAFESMVKAFKADYAGGQVLAVNEAVKLGKLVQICCGVAYDTDGGEMALPCAPRVDLVREIIEEAEAKVIVFVPYTGALKMLATELAKHFTVESIYGAVSKGERDRIFADFQKRTDPRVLVADARTMSHGLNLTAANTIVWYGPTTSNDTYGQANERIPRPGQKLDTNIIHIESTPIEQKMYDRLRKKSSLQGTLLEMLKGV